MDYSEKWGSNVDEATNLALAELGLSLDEVTVTVLEEPSSGFLGIGQKPALVRVEKKKAPVKEKETIEEKLSKIKENKKNEVKEKKEDKFTNVTSHKALNFLNELISDMGLTLSLKAKEDKEGTIFIDIDGKDSSTIIGKRGQTLDAIQYLTSLVVNKEEGPYIRVVVDCEGYRKKRERTLEQLALRLAAKVSKQKRPMKLEPMNPYERKVIHATLQNHPSVKTRSEGEEPYRRVIIELK